MSALLKNIPIIILFICFLPILFLGLFDLDEGVFANFIANVDR